LEKAQAVEALQEAAFFTTNASIDVGWPLLLQWLSALLFGGPIEITLVDFALFE
jgi:hypothetical protein